MKYQTVYLKPKSIKCLFLCAFISISSICHSQQSGDLDLTFSFDGMQTSAFGSGWDIGSTVAVQSDGKIVVAGSTYIGTNSVFAVLRYNTDGSLDYSFSGDGKQTTAIGNGADAGLSLALQTDGKIVVAGTSNDDFAIVRYNIDGSLDNSFSGDGKQTTGVGSSYDQGKAVAIQSDGKILVAGFSSIGTVNDFSIVRYNIDGSLDNTFSGDGKQTTDFGNGEDYGYALAIQDNGKILVAGYSSTGTNYVFAIVRYNLDGSLDNSFSGDGKQITAIGSNSFDYTTSIAIQDDGKLLVVGYSNDGSNNDFALVRYNTDGSLDNTFSSDGIQSTSIGISASAYSVKIQADGKILVAGFSDNGANTDFTLVRYDTYGNLDNSFSADGIQTTAIGIGSGDEGYSLDIQSDGKIIVAGTSNFDFAIARYHSIDGTVSYEEKTNIDPISASIIPSPFQNSGILKINSNLALNSLFSIYNSFGQIVYNQLIFSPESALNLELCGGVYSYSINDKNGLILTRGKFVIEQNK